jgi:hypothetical protein
MKEARMAAAMVAAVAGWFVVGVTLAAPAGALAGGPEGANAVGWQSPAARCEAMARDLRIAPELHPIVADLCRRSSTFRRQVARLSDEDGLVVTVEQMVIPSTSPWRAQSAIARVGGHVRTADVQVPAGDSRLVAEMMAHEFEHILEQLDGIDLKQWVGHSGVWRTGTGSGDEPIETERARQVGRLVAGEYVAAAAAMTARRMW